jgi:hypothetical protein
MGKEQNTSNEGAAFPVRFEIESGSEDQTKKLQSFFGLRGESITLAELRKKIYERGLRTYSNELAEVRRIEKGLKAEGVE